MDTPPIDQQIKKILILLLILVISPVIGGLYGILHDQLTYTIAPEYYTKFKFHQFGLVDTGDKAENPRLYVCIVGFLATWWMGLPIGLILGRIGWTYSSWKDMFRFTMKAISITVIVAFLTGLIGLAYGHFILANQPKENFSNWFLPDNLIDIKNFIKVGSMHNFSYLGGLTGLIAGIIYLVRQRPRTTTNQV